MSSDQDNMGNAQKDAEELQAEQVSEEQAAEEQASEEHSSGTEDHQQAQEESNDSDSNVSDNASDNEEQVGEEPPEEETVESLKSALEAAELSVKDEALRAQAEIQNIRRRSERDVSNAHKFGQEKLIKELFAVVDSLERGIQTVDEQEGELDPAVKAIRDGSDLTLKMLMGVLEKFQVKQVDPEGEPFDPQLHEAISMIDNPDVEPNSIISVVQKGYTLNDRLVRPAMVVVSKS